MKDLRIGHKILVLIIVIASGCQQDSQQCIHSATGHCVLDANWTTNPPKPIKSKFHRYVENNSGKVEPILYKSCSATSDITIEYSANFPSNAQSACNFAIEIWEQYIDSDQPIHIIANWQNLGAGALGFGGPRLIFGQGSLQSDVFLSLIHISEPTRPY